MARMCWGVRAPRATVIIRSIAALFALSAVLDFRQRLTERNRLGVHFHPLDRRSSYLIDFLLKPALADDLCYRIMHSINGVEPKRRHCYEVFIPVQITIIEDFVAQTTSDTNDFTLESLGSATKWDEIIP